MFEAMTPRERLMAAIGHQPVDRIPTDYQATGEATAKFQVLGVDGTGYILAPCHSIQVITPVENVVAMYRAPRVGRMG